MVRTRSQLENLSEDKLIDEVLNLENFKNSINAKFSELNHRFNDFQAKYEMVNSNLSISRRCSDLLLECISQLEHNKFNDAQCNRRESAKINPVSSDFAEDVLEQSVYQALLLTGISVEPDDLQACYGLRKKDRIIIKFKCRKQKHRVFSNRKTLQNKSLDLTQYKPFHVNCYKLLLLLMFLTISCCLSFAHIFLPIFLFLIPSYSKSCFPLSFSLSLSLSLSLSCLLN